MFMYADCWFVIANRCFDMYYTKSFRVVSILYFYAYFMIVPDFIVSSTNGTKAKCSFEDIGKESFYGGPVDKGSDR